MQKCYKLTILFVVNKAWLDEVKGFLRGQRSTEKSQKERGKGVGEGGMA